MKVRYKKLGTICRNHEIYPLEVPFGKLKTRVKIYYKHGLHHLKLKAKALILNDANHVYDRFRPLFLAFQRILLKDRFHDFYKLFPIFYILPSYQNISETETNSDKH